jgi:hypothetical protein
MPLIDPDGRPFVQCAQCRTAVVIPSAEHVAELSAFAKLSRHDSISAMRHAEKHFALDAREAKALVLHVPTEFGHCHRCNEPVADGVSVCSCRSANLNW